MSLTLDTPIPAPESTGHPRRWLILFVILAAECMDLLDATIVNVAAPSIRTSLGASFSALQWIIGGYALTFAVGLITGGRLGDMFGRRRMFLLGATGFVLASVLCGASQSPGMLIAARLVQGSFAAILIPQGFGIMKQVFPADELPKAFGMFGPVMGMAALAAPIIGGALVDVASWRWVFLINVPVGAAALIGAYRLLPESRAAVKPRTDFGGVALVAAGTALIMYPLIQGREQGWPAWMLVAIAAGVALLGVFAAYEVRLSRRGGDPLVLPSLFSRRGFSGGMALSLVWFTSIMGLILVFTLYLQLNLGFSPIHAGLTMIPFSLFVAVGAGLSGGFLAARYGRPVLTTGIVVMVAGALGLIWVIHHNGQGLTSWDCVAPQALLGLGFGLFVAPFFDTILAAVDDDAVGSASGTLNAVQQLGGATGAAALGTVFFSSGFSAAAWLATGLLAATILLSFLLPKWAREPQF